MQAAEFCLLPKAGHPTTMPRANQYIGTYKVHALQSCSIQLRGMELRQGRHELAEKWVVKLPCYCHSPEAHGHQAAVQMHLSLNHLHQAAGYSINPASLAHLVIAALPAQVNI